MAFRRFQKSKSFSRIRNPSSLARKRRTWETAFLANYCCPSQAVLEECSECNSGTQIQFILMSQTTLQNEFSDSAKVKRLVGDMWFLPAYTSPPSDPQELASALQGLQFWQAFTGLRRKQVNNSGIGFNVFPLDNPYDYSESKWIKTWQQIAIGNPQIGITLQSQKTINFAVQCAEVTTTGAPDNIFTNGTGTFGIETDCTTPNCFPCLQPENDADVTLSSALGQRPYHWRPNWKSRKGIRLTENEELVVDFNFAFPNIAAFNSYGPVVNIIGGVKLLVEY